MWTASVKDIQGEILCVSQFTLLANTSKGNKPDFHHAMVRIVNLASAAGARLYFLFIHSPARKPADQSQAMYASFLQFMSTQYTPEKIKGKPLIDP
jgi:D-Tyr-tRNA(Tyr) deacylase